MHAVFPSQTIPRVVPLILAGGSGTRLWPVSRDGMPKQFLPLVGNRSTFQQALARVSDPELFEEPIVMTHEAFRFFVREQTEQMGLKATIVLEPERRDTAPAVAAGMLIAERLAPDALVMMVAADHVIPDQDIEAFKGTVRSAREAAIEGNLVTFGIKPTEPKTTYGYIRCGEPLNEPGVFKATAFIEKPDAASAARYIGEGYLWNCGNLVFRTEVMRGELLHLAPKLLGAAEDSVTRAQDDLGFLRLDQETFAEAPRISISYAVLERTKTAVVVEGNFRWADIGSWDSILAASARDKDGNAVTGDVALLDSRNCVVHASGRLTALIGVKDVVVATTPDAVLVADIHHADEVRTLVTRLADAGRVEARQHRRLYKPWGVLELLDQGERFQVRRIVLRPGAALSMQMHLHRAEHWVVVSGVARITIDGHDSVLHENQSAFIPAGTVHRLANPGRIPLEVIEVQTGSYLGEDDVTRYDTAEG
ncbi:MAG: mannose-1-phosphate guanylyltransferase/mannose-6-phosphate isomerase [Methylacidiphilales bacterium]|nr:mannose-1-phosphate guanylyltransferase/mannose-6-phosphate isomerase [Candidatus Methylacidiphilales bacterium]